MAAATVLSPPEDANSPARRTVSREDLLAAALKLIGPHRSLSTLSLREVAREAGIAPNSFYRQFRDMDELAVALIDVGGRPLSEGHGAPVRLLVPGRRGFHWAKRVRTVAPDARPRSLESPLPLQ